MSMETNTKGNAANTPAANTVNANNKGNGEGKGGKGNTHEPASVRAREVKITEDPKNYRRHNARNLSLIEKSLTDCGAGRSIVADAAGVVIGGNGTLRMAKKRGIKQKIVHTNGDELVVVVRDDIAPDDPRRKELALADNATSDSSDFDFSKLKTEFTPAELSDWDISPVDFSGIGEEAVCDFPKLSSEDHPATETMSFTLSREQAETVRDILADAKKREDFQVYHESMKTTDENANSNGNALFWALTQNNG